MAAMMADAQAMGALKSGPAGKHERKPTVGRHDMAKTARDDLFDRLRVSGLRKKVAKRVSKRLDKGRSPKQLQRVIDELKAVTGEIEDRVKGGPARRRSRGAKKAAATRKRNAARRRASARKAARTRAKAS
jgi:hypothetical protein